MEKEIAMNMETGTSLMRMARLALAGFGLALLLGFASPFPGPGYDRLQTEQADGRGVIIGDTVLAADGRGVIIGTQTIA